MSKHSMMLRSTRFIWTLAVVAGCGTLDDGTVDPIDERVVAVGGKSDAFGYQEGTPEANGILKVANELSSADLKSKVGISTQANKGIVASRPFSTLTRLDAVPYVGKITFAKLLAYAQANGDVGVPATPPAPVGLEIPVGAYQINVGTYQDSYQSPPYDSGPGHSLYLSMTINADHTYSAQRGPSECVWAAGLAWFETKYQSHPCSQTETGLLTSHNFGGWNALMTDYAPDYYGVQVVSSTLIGDLSEYVLPSIRQISGELVFMLPNTQPTTPFTMKLIPPASASALPLGKYSSSGESYSSNDSTSTWTPIAGGVCDPTLTIENLDVTQPQGPFRVSYLQAPLFEIFFVQGLGDGTFFGHKSESSTSYVPTPSNVGDSTLSLQLNPSTQKITFSALIGPDPNDFDPNSHRCDGIATIQP